MAYSNVWKGKGLYINYSGFVSTDEVIKANLEMHGDPRFDDLKYIICDYLSIDEVKYDPGAFTQEVSKLAQLNAAASKSNPHVKRAVVTVDETVLAFTHWYNSESADLEHHWEAAIFSTIADAEAWVLNE